MKIVSQKQARFLGAIAGGNLRKKGGPTRTKARKMLLENRGFKMRDLPVRVPSRTPKRTNYRSGGR